MLYIQSLLHHVVLLNYSCCKYSLTAHPSPLHLAQRTVELHASKRIYNKPSPPELPYQSITLSLQILYAIACGLESSGDITRFWEELSVNFVLMCLHWKQLAGTIEGMTRLLETSVLADRGQFGPRGEFEDEGIPKDPVELVLDKMTLNLVEKPRAGCTKEEVQFTPIPYSLFAYS
jgi:Protein of unknown function (DUF3636)